MRPNAPTAISGCRLLGLHGDSVVRFIVRSIPMHVEWQKICAPASEVAIISWRTGKLRKLEGCEQDARDALWVVLGKRCVYV